MPPCICISTAFGLIARPQSTTHATRFTVIDVAVTSEISAT